MTAWKLPRAARLVQVQDAAAEDGARWAPAARSRKIAAPGAPPLRRTCIVKVVPNYEFQVNGRISQILATECRARAIVHASQACLPAARGGPRGGSAGDAGARAGMARDPRPRPARRLAWRGAAEEEKGARDRVH